MVANHSNDYEEFRFVDPSVDPSILFDVASNLVEGYGAIQAMQEMLRRFPAVEYAVGFDGIDDWVRLDKLDLARHNLEIKSRIWIPQDSSGNYILDITDEENKSIIGIASAPDDDSTFRFHYKGSEGIQTQTLPKLNLETWQNIRIWSSGNGFSVTVDGNQVAFGPNVDLGRGLSKVYFGTNSHRTMYFEGMVKHLGVNLGSEQIFSLKGSSELQIEDKTNIATTAGIHNMKKGRFNKEFRVVTS
jgi:hypothetical protein